MSIFARLFRDNRPASYRNSESYDAFSDDTDNFRHGIHHHHHHDEDNDDDNFDGNNSDDDNSDSDSGDDGGGDD